MSMKPNGKSIISSSDDNSDKKNGSNPLLSAAVKAKGKAHVSSDDNRRVMRLFKLVSMSGALEELDICLEDVILRAAQMEQIVEKVCEERLNTGVSNISVYFYEQFHFFKGWKLTNTVCFTSRS
ncbi:unnamed protein product [Brassica napus]|uniref:(rape) hypothetical protein n=1 Tax=Brassica napus TaxID=3708 RepID=A0A816MSQ4_BRANA|nr:unnamed protein product [Brassica napus]